MRGQDTHDPVPGWTGRAPMSPPADAPGHGQRQAGFPSPPTRPEVAWDHAGAALALVSGKWVLGVLQALQAGSLRHNELRRRLGGTVSARSLDSTLRRMEGTGLVNRRVHPGSPPAVSYELTTLARSLVTGPLAMIGRWHAVHQRAGDPAA
jgi:DNA-binding HxlR family transcriptional regulator